MDFTYRVNVDNNEWSETKEDLKYGIYSSEFKNKDPFVARQEAFNLAKSYEEIFRDANKIGADHFFEKKNEIYKNFAISVALIDPATSEEIEIDFFEPFDEKDLNERYKYYEMNHLLQALEKELEVFIKNNILLDNKIKKIIVHNYQQQKEKKTIEIIPTEYIYSDEIKIMNISDLL